MMVTKGISFNLNDPKQKELYEYAISVKNFSGHIKTLLERDKMARKKPQGGGGIKIIL